MDANKRLKLIEIDYTIKKICGDCAHSYFKPDIDWGTCELNTYNHLKHTDTSRFLSINKSGSCPSYSPDPTFINNLELFAEFIET